MKKLILIPIVLIVIFVSYKIHYRIMDIETKQSILIYRQGKKNDGSNIWRRKTPYEEGLYKDTMYYEKMKKYGTYEVGDSAGDFGR